MKLLITGGTGFIGTALCEKLLHNSKNELTLLSRNPEKIKTQVKVISNLKQLDKDTSFDVIINLAGEPIADKRWTENQKQKIITSRIDITEQIIEFIKTAKHTPDLLINGSAIGYYGINKTNIDIDENATGDNSFSSNLCKQWETSALQANSFGVRTCLLRTGIVLGKNGGALSKMLPPFKMGLGGKIGSGKQWMPWIHLDDLVGIILYCIKHDNLTGAINGTSPNPVTNQVFTKTLGKALNRPTFMSIPETIIKLLMGQMGMELLLSGKKILPIKITEKGYTFKYPTLDKALQNIL
ncbi:MAG: TIGR01777 family oxidoreductase [Gammaproteobacteria bacterium]|nr:TIGR01777 family oxidoreductase [Gammaproteobacteria bacterium]